MFSTSWHMYAITKTRLYNVDSLKSHFYIVKLRFTGVYIIFLIFAQNIDCVYSLEPPRRGGSNEYPQSMFWAEIWKISEFFIWKFSIFCRWNFLYIWIGVFVMSTKVLSWKIWAQLFKTKQMSLLNVSLKLWSLNMAYMLIFFLKKKCE